MTLPVKAGRPKRVDRLAVAERQAEAARMAARGIPYEDIADDLGYSGKGAVANAIRACRDAMKATAGDEWKLAQLEKLDALEAGAWEDITHPAPKVSNSGHLIKLCTDCKMQVDPKKGTCPKCGGEEGEIVTDKADKNAARNTVLHVIRTRAEILGLYAAKKSITADTSAVQAVKELAEQFILGEVVSEED